MDKLFFININTFGHVPIMKSVIHYLKQSYQIHLVESHINGTYSYSEVAIVNYIGSFKDSQSFNHQSKIYKYYKYLFVLIYAFIKMLFNRNCLIYSNDYQVIAIVCKLKAFFKFKRVFIIYHQFELTEDQTLNSLNRFLFNKMVKYSNEINFVVVPENNRLLYLKSQLNYDEGKMMLFPNTNSGVKDSDLELHPLIKDIPENAKLIGHIGSVGPNHYIENYLKAISEIKRDDCHYLIVGKQSDKLNELFEKYAIKNLIIIPELPHRVLNSIYKRLDIGLILYKAIDKNFEYCAPNKLYEYWANGVPVLANNLKGLEDVFDNPKLGLLIDFEKIESIKSAIEKILNEANRSEIRNIFNQEFKIDEYLVQLITYLKENHNA